jgi:DNA polymerase-3 subunit epsilon
MLERLSLRLRVFLFFAGLAAGGIAALAGGLWLAQSRLGPDAGGAAVRAAFVQGGLIAGFVLVGLIAWVWVLFDTHVARALDGLAAAIRARAHADVTDEIDLGRARYLGDLTPAAAAVARSLAATRNALAESVARETSRLSAEKARLETLLADVPVGVLLCTGEHQLVFYNSQAVDLLGTGQSPGLARNVFDYLREGPVRHAYKRLHDANDRDAASDLLIATTGTARVLAARMRVLARRDPGIAPGYVLTLRDVTADMAAHTAREALLAEVFDRVRRPAANLQTVIGVLAEQDGAAPTPPELGEALLQEVRALGAAITELGARYDAGRADWRPLAQTRSEDLMDSLRARIEASGLRVDIDAPDLILNCDGFELVALVAGLAERLAAAGHARAFHIALVEEDGPGARIDLEWNGPPLSIGELERWLTQPVDPAAGALTGHAVLQMHGTEMWPDLTGEAGRARLRMPIAQARRAVRRPPAISRAVVYDFDLLSKARNDRVADNRLEDLTYVVFDTETTGLAPSSDEIVQIAAVRVVNGRRVEREVFDTLVDPHRPIPPGSTAVHGITDAMVRGAPDIAEAGRRFHRFAEGAVLVAHNAPFDMEFLRRHEGAIGARFDHPVLDTVLLSAVLFGQQEEHSLDALTARLGITIPEEARHTALGDTVATADAFLKLLPMLRGRGFATFGDVLAEVRRHGRLLKDLNAEQARVQGANGSSG